MRLNYEYIISKICAEKGISREEVYEILRNKDMKYLYLLLLKKYDCIELEEIKKDFRINSKRSLKYNQNRAQEKLLVNYGFRKKYFDLDNVIGRDDKVQD